MKKFIYIFFLLILFSCAEEKEVDDSRYFHIKGRFKNVDEGELVSLFLKKPDANVLVDSSRFDKEGKFVLKGLNDNKEFYILKTNSSDYEIILILDTAETINVSGNIINLLSSYNVNGSRDSKYIQELEQHLYKTTTTIDSLGTIFKQYYQTPQVDLIKPTLDSIFHITTTLQREYSDNFIDKQKGSLASLIAVSQYITPKDPIYDKAKDSEVFFKIDKALMIRYNYSLHVQQMNTFCKRLRKDIERDKLKSNKLTVGMKAPEISSFRPNGSKISLDSIRTRYTLISFWASWSTVSKQENYNINKNYWTYFHKFDVLQISLDKDKEAWKNEIDSSQLHWFHACDFNQWNSKAVVDYKIKTLPANFLIDPQGIIVAKNIFGDDLQTTINKIIK